MRTRNLQCRTSADQRADEHIRAALAALTPDIPVVTEECIGNYSASELAGLFWLVDPLDGTREFIARNGEFTVNIALIDCGAPVMGVVHAPALGHCFSGLNGSGATVADANGTRPIVCRLPPAEGLTVLSSRSHASDQALEQFMAGRGTYDVTPAGSSLKFCLIAAGQADLYPRLGRTMEWDTAAGHAVLQAAGGEVKTLDGLAMTYGKPGFANAHFFAHGLQQQG
jgi:3'(2'), 5'-bisphosphate nucleotidase